jgi:predicted PurR-regulated permease PerM
MKLPFIFKLIFNRYFFEKAFALFILGLIIYALQSFLLIFLFAFLFAFLFLDLSKWLMSRIDLLTTKMDRGRLRTTLKAVNKPTIIISLIYIGFITMISLMFYSLIPQLIEETKWLIKIAPQITSQLTMAATTLQSQVNFDLGIDETIANLVSQENIETTLIGVFENVKNIGIFILKITIALILSYIFIIDRAKIEHFMDGIKLGNFAFIHEQFSIIFGKITKSFGLLFKAQSLIALANAILTTIGLLVISFIHGGESFPFIATLAVIVFILGFIPVFGFLISSLPIVLIGFNYGGTDIVIGILIMITIIHAVEAYYLNPKIVSSYMEFPVFITFVVLLLSEHYMGFIGLLIGVPLLYIIVDLFKDIDLYVTKIQKISHTIDVQKVATTDAIHKNIRLSRSGKRSSE